MRAFASERNYIIAVCMWIFDCVRKQMGECVRVERMWHNDGKTSIKNS